jgi:hypothetical protein
MSDDSNNRGCGCGSLGISSIVGIVFITLKLTHYIAWSWVWVLAPFWAGYAFAALIFIVLLGATLLAGLATRR